MHFLLQNKPINQKDLTSRLMDHLKLPYEFILLQQEHHQLFHL